MNNPSTKKGKDTALGLPGWVEKPLKPLKPAGTFASGMEHLEPRLQIRPGTFGDTEWRYQ